MEGHARLGQHPPARHDLLDRRERAPEQDRGGDHHAGGGLVRDDEIGADRQDRDLDHLAQRARRRSERDARARNGALKLVDLLIQLPPASDQRGRHAERLHDLGVGQRSLEISAGQGSLALHGFDSAACQSIVQDGEQEHEHRADDRRNAEQRVAEPDHRDVHDEPGSIEQGDQPVRREQTAQRRDVAQRLAVHALRAARPGRDHHLGDRGCKRVAHHVADDALQPSAQVVERQRDSQGDRGPERENGQRFAALADEDPIEHLEHEDRGHEQQQVAEEGERRDVGQGAPQRTSE